MEDKREEVSRLDGCYCIKTDLKKEQAEAQIIHDRYKDLAEIEQAFRMMKNGVLELRPIYVRKEDSTKARVFVVMLAYIIIKELKRL